jgi:hypothetical protein
VTSCRSLIDWNTADPTDRLDEIAAIAWWNAQLHDDDIAERLPVLRSALPWMRFSFP